MGWLASLDEALFRVVNYPANRVVALDRFVFDVADSTLLQGGLFLAIYWSLWFAKHGTARDATRRNVVSAILGGTVVAILARVLQLGLPFHQRPLYTPSVAPRFPIGLDASTLNAWSSFPSDHAVFFFALCVPIWARSRWLGGLAFLWTLLVVCVPRVYLGYHYPSDILGGAVIGVALMSVLQPAIGRSGLGERIIRWEALYSGRFYAVAFLLCFELALLFSDVRHFGVDMAQAARAVLGDSAQGQVAAQPPTMPMRSH